MLNKNSKIFVAGHKGLVGSAIVRELIKKGYKNILTINRKNIDLKNQKNTFNFLKEKKPKFIFIAAAKVGGIYSNNKYRADFIYDNLAIQNNLIHGAFRAGVKDLIFLGSSCVYPKLCKQPIKEKYLLTGPLEQTNEPYAIAKIAGIKMCESYNQQYNTNYKCLMPTNTFGPGDNYHSLNSHFFPSLIRKIHEAKIKKLKKLEIWGDGSPKRELIYVNDLESACVYFMKKKTKETLINIGTGRDFSIKQYVLMLLKNIYPKNQLKIFYNKSKPNGTPRKVLNIDLANKLGWKPKISLKRSILLTYKDYVKNYNSTLT